MRDAGQDVISLTAGEPDFPTPPHVKMAAIQAIEENFTHYTPNCGIAELLKAIVEKFKRDNNLHFEPSQILVSCGAKHSIFNALQAICNKGDEVVLASPYWVSYPEMVKLVDAKPVIVQTTPETNFKITPVQLKRAINAKTKAFIFNTPCNPTGSVYSQGEIEELADVIADTGIYVISDEIYEKVIYDGVKHFSIGAIKQIKDHVITVNGVSKAYAMTGWRIGYLGAPKAVAEAAAKVQSQITSNATSIAQRAAVVALTAPSNDTDAMVAEFKRRRDFVAEQLSKISGIELQIPKGAFYLFPSVKAFVGKRVDDKLIKDDMDMSHFLLQEEQLAVVPGSAFGAKNYLRLSYAASMKELEKAVQRLQSGLKKLREGY
ncbi:MAG: pyridoxal phosphate-dependent aminotransferase [Ignavibacteriae bacterium]|nr:pyridoxal phosphate-dependent aminotransferase [Ignavibacteriota bacterium]